MNAFQRCQTYLRATERRLLYLRLGRGFAALACAALTATLLLTWWTNRAAFAAPSMFRARVVLFLAIGGTFAFAVAIPLLRLTRRRAARLVEDRVPEFEQRLLTLAGQQESDANPFREVLAREVEEISHTAPPSRLAPSRAIAALSIAGFAACSALIWLIAAGPGYAGYGASLLWTGVPPGNAAPLYKLQVSPGNRKVRRGSDQLIEVRLQGFDASAVTLFARPANSSRWAPAAMERSGAGARFQFVLAGLSESLDYFVEAGALRSEKFSLAVVDMPGVKRVKVTYTYPKWSGLKQATEDPGGDLRAVEGTEAEVEIELDRPLSKASLSLDTGAAISLEPSGENRLRARVPILADGSYFVAALDGDEPVRISQDYFIEAMKERPPAVRITSPGRDAKVSPIEEVTLEAEAEDDFALESAALYYSVNGGPEQTIGILPRKGVKQTRGSYTLALEEFKLSPGDVVSLYATARDARSTSRTEILFLEAQPYEKEYSQSQASGGGMEGQQQQDNNISRRQKEIIAATWNQVRDAKPRSAAREDAEFLSGIQSKLRDQARSLSARMRSRELSGTNQEFQAFSAAMDAAAQAMTEASDRLKTQRWQDALPPEQRALQHLLRAEAVFKEIQVAFGQQSGGQGAGGGQGRDLENLLDLELDTEKNQYETGQSALSRDQRSQEVDEALKRLEELARRQKELAQQDQQKQQAAQQRWTQEMLRREAEELKRRMEQMARSQQDRNQDSRLDRALDELGRATNDMRRAGSQNDPGGARRAAERLDEARESLGGMRRQEAGQQVEELVKRAEKLAEQQKDFAGRLKSEVSPPQPGKMADEKDAMRRDLERLESAMRSAVRDLAGSQRTASSRVREALGQSQQEELRLRMQLNGEWIRKGMGNYVAGREQVVTQGLEKLRDKLRDARQSLGPESGDREATERALARVERLRSELGGTPSQQAERELGELRRAAGQAAGSRPIGASLSGELDQLELLLRRRLEEKGSGVRGVAPDKIPAGYSDAVAEYFRLLSRGK